MARRQPTNTNIRTGQGLSTNVQSAEYAAQVDTSKISRADNFLRQLSTAQKGIDMVTGVLQSNADAQAAKVKAAEQAKVDETKRLIALEEIEQKRIDNLIEAENLKQTKINNEIANINAQYSAEGRVRAREDRLKAANKEAQDKIDKMIEEQNKEIKRKGLATIGINPPTDSKDIEAVSNFYNMARNAEAKGITGAERIATSIIVSNGTSIADSVVQEEKARRVREGLAPLDEVETYNLYVSTIQDYTNSIGVDYLNADEETYTLIKNKSKSLYESAMDDSSKFIAKNIDEADKLKESQKKVIFANSFINSKGKPQDKVASLSKEISRRQANGEADEAIVKSLTKEFETMIDNNPSDLTLDGMNAFIQTVRDTAGDKEGLAVIGNVAGNVDKLVKEKTAFKSAQLDEAKARVGKLTDKDFADQNEMVAKAKESINNIQDPIARQEATDDFNLKQKISIDRYNQKVADTNKAINKSKVSYQLSNDERKLVQDKFSEVKSATNFNMLTAKDENGNDVPTNSISQYWNEMSSYKNGTSQNYLGNKYNYNLELNSPKTDAEVNEYLNQIEKIKQTSKANGVSAYDTERFLDANPALKEAIKINDMAKATSKSNDVILAEVAKTKDTRGETSYNLLSDTQKKDADSLFNTMLEKDFYREFDDWGFTPEMKLSDMKADTRDYVRESFYEMYKNGDLNEDTATKFIQNIFDRQEVNKHGAFKSDFPMYDKAFDDDDYLDPTIAAHLAIETEMDKDWDDEVDYNNFVADTSINRYENFVVSFNPRLNAYNIIGTSKETGMPKVFNANPIPKALIEKYMNQRFK